MSEATPGDDSIVATKPSRIAPLRALRDDQKKERDELRKELSEQKTAERAAMRPPAVARPKMFPSGSLQTVTGGSRQPLLLNVPSTWTREELLADGALKLNASGVESKVGCKIDVMAIDMSWGDELLITQHEPQIGLMRLWPVPGRHWTRSEKIEAVTFEDCEIRPAGMHGWTIHRLDGTLLESRSFPSIAEAKVHVVTRLTAKKIS